MNAGVKTRMDYTAHIVTNSKGLLSCTPGISLYKTSGNNAVLQNFSSR